MRLFQSAQILKENEPPNQLYRVTNSRCNFGAISVEKMEIMDSMDNLELTPSRGWTEITPINAVFSHPIGFEVRRLF